MKTANAKKPNLLPLLLLFSFAVFLCLSLLFSEPKSLAAGTKKEYLNIKTNEQRLALLSSFGRECESAPVKMYEVTVPREFDKTYKAYNELQKPLGLDLSRFRGETLRCYTYVVTNHPDMGTVYANLLFSFDEFVGGDVSSAAPSGLLECLIASS
ncbi:MAG: DUF4830 domain-containing protein [Clostridia bacterium]|nr:DUF4830 domain-containing protein [Clostridia bacterium]